MGLEPQSRFGDKSLEIKGTLPPKWDCGSKRDGISVHFFIDAALGWDLTLSQNIMIVLIKY